MGRVEPLVWDVVPIAEARRISNTLRDEANNLRGTAFVW